MPAGSALANTTKGAYTKNVGAVKDTGASRSTSPSTSPTVSNVNSENATRSATTAASSLPFTGIDILPLAAGGAALLGAGLFVRRLSNEN